MNTAVAKTPLRQVRDVKTLLHNDQAREQLAAVAAQHMNPQRLMRVTANAIRQTPKLQQCEPLSFLGALMQCAALGLEPNTVLGHAYLIPFDKTTKVDGRWVKVPEVQLVIGYKGLIDLARRSGHITSISANIHYSDDEMWDYEEGTEAKLRHRPGPQDGTPVHAYAIAQFKDGGHAYVVYPWAQVMKIRNGSQGWQSAVKFGKQEGSPWHTHEAAMAKKTMIRALSKYLPLSVEFSDAVQIDNDGGSKVDYASYAINPEDGPTIEGEAIEHEDEPEDEKEDPAKKEAPKEKPKAKSTDKPKTREKVDYETGEVTEEAEGDDNAEGEPEKAAPKEKPKAEKKAEAGGDKHAKVKDMIASDLTDGAPAGATRGFYSDQLDAMKAEAPGIYAEVEALFEDAEGD